MTYGEKAKELKDTLNCAQSVVVALDELTGLDEKTSKALSTGMGGGLRCGAVLAIGMTVGADGMGKPGGRVAMATKQLAAEFKEKFGAIRCEDLLAMSDDDHSVCYGFCEWCADKAAEIIGK